MTLIVVVTGSCSKSADVKCGPGTVLKDGQCVVAPSPTAPTASPTVNALEPGSGAQPVSTTLVGAGSNSAPQTDALQWRFETERDKMRDKNVYVAVLPDATNQIAIILRKGEPGSNHGTDAILKVAREQFQCSYEGCAFAVKFDDQPVVNWSMSEAQTDTRALFFENAQSFITKLRKAHKVMVEVNLFQRGREQVEWNVPPLDSWEGFNVDKALAKAQAADAQSAYCFAHGSGTSCGKTAEDCHAYMEALSVTDATCKKVAKSPCSFEAGTPYCDG